MREAIVGVALVALLLIGGCGGGDGDSGYSEDDVADALGLRFEGNDLLYELPSGNDCIVVNILTSEDKVEAAQDEAGAIDSAVATNSSGDVGVEFGGYTGFSPDECVDPAESDLNDLPSK